MTCQHGGSFQSCWYVGTSGGGWYEYDESEMVFEVVVSTDKPDSEAIQESQDSQNFDYPTLIS